MQSMILEKVYYAGVRELRWSSGTPLEFLGLFRSFCSSSAIHELLHCEFWEDLKTGKALVHLIENFTRSGVSVSLLASPPVAIPWRYETHLSDATKPSNHQPGRQIHHPYDRESEDMD